MSKSESSPESTSMSMSEDSGGGYSRKADDVFDLTGVLNMKWGLGVVVDLTVINYMNNISL